MSIVSEEMNNLEILLKAGKTLKVDDESYTMIDDYSGALTHVFTSKETGTLYTIRDEDIAGFGEKWVASTLERLIGSREEKPKYDCMFG